MSKDSSKEFEREVKQYEELFVADYIRRSYERMDAAGVPYRDNEGNRKTDTQKFAISAWNEKKAQLMAAQDALRAELRKKVEND